MDIIRFVISKPVSVTVGVILLVMFGLIGAGAIPIQLAPNVDRPIIEVTTEWPGRSPEEVVDQITKEQEERLKNVSNLKSMRSTSSQGEAKISLEFYVGSDISRALQEVSDSLRQVPEYPDDVDEPRIKAADGASENAIAWIIIELERKNRARHPDFDISTLYDALDKEVKPYLERIDGVAEVNIYGGREREARILADPQALARFGLTYSDLVTALRNENQNVSTGAIAEGKRDYRVRVIGRFQSAEDILGTIITYHENAPIYVRDVATAEIGYVKRRGFVRSIEGDAIAMNCIRQTNANVMAVMQDLRARLEEVRAEILPNLHPTVGPDLRLRQVYDETTYIQSAIDLVTQNLWIGGLLAAAVLLLFLRSIVATGVIALAIPISVVGTFLALLALGRTLNVISLAGLAFAVGMVVDNAVVVLENTDRRIKAGDPPRVAAYTGAKEVWGAVLASTLTTVAVFIPVLTIQEESGQLFRDISLAIVCAVTLSLIVSITVIPAACSRWLRRYDPSKHGRLDRAWHNLFGLAPFFSAFVAGASRITYWLITDWRGWTIRPALIIFMTVVSLWGSWMLMPPLDYLPAGNRNLVFGGLLIPPGYSVDQFRAIADRIDTQMEPYVKAEIDDPAAMAALPSIRRPPPNEPFDPVPVDNYFIGAFGGGMFMGATSKDPQVVIPVGQLLSNAMNSIPDAFGGARQTSLFGRGVLAGGNSINLEISGPRLPRVRTAADAMFHAAAGKFGYQNVRPEPANFNLAQPEWRVRLTQVGRELGFTTSDLGVAARALFDGAFIGDFDLAGDAIDLVVVPVGGELAYKEKLASIPIVTPSGRIVPLDTVAEIVPALAPQQIQRIEELPSVTIAITPPEGEALETVMQRIEQDVVETARSAGLIDSTMRIRMEGTAAKLDEVRASLIGAARPRDSLTGWQRAIEIVAGVTLLAGAAFCAYGALRAVRNKRRDFAYGAVGGLLLGVILAGVLFLVATQPQLGTARMVWALVVTYLLMAALFESFIYPFVIMFSVPLAIVGGFAGLRLVHDSTMANPVLAPQQLDVITMLGFVILIGVVVNNAILLVHQALNFMHGVERPDLEGRENDAPALLPMRAIAEAVRTRFRPIFMTTLTSVLGMAPLAIFPGAGSELYRGLGAVMIGGLLVSTVFTLVLVPMLFSIVVQMATGFRALLKPASAAPASPSRGEPIVAAEERSPRQAPAPPALQPA